MAGQILAHELQDTCYKNPPLSETEQSLVLYAKTLFLPAMYEKKLPFDIDCG